MDSRAQFEAWMVGAYDTRLLREGENYMGYAVQQRWEAWQASRAAIEIALPEKISPHNTNESGYVIGQAAMYDEGIDDCAEALAISGLRYKFGTTPEGEGNG